MAVTVVRNEVAGYLLASAVPSLRRARTFPYYPGMALRHALTAAGGLSGDAYLREAEVARLPSSRINGNLADTIRVPLDSLYIVDRDSSRYLGPRGLPRPASGAPEFALDPFDNVLILRQPDWELQQTVAVTGQVRFPGRYALLNRGEKTNWGQILSSVATALTSALTTVLVVQRP